MLIIKNGRLHIGDGTVIEKGDILINGTKIEQVAPEIVCEEAEVIDASGKEVFPGLYRSTVFHWRHGDSGKKYGHR